MERRAEQAERGRVSFLDQEGIMACFMLMKWFNRESRTDNVLGDKEMIAKAKSLGRWNGVGFYIYVLRLALEKAGILWSQLQEWKQCILLQLQWAYIFSHTHTHTHTHTQVFLILHCERTAKS